MTPELRQSVHEGGSAANRAVNLVLSRRRSWAILLAGSVAQVVLFYGVGLLGQTSRYLGIPGAAAALIGVVAAVVAGPVVGAGVALVGGAAFVVFVTEYGEFVTVPAIVIAITVWTLAAIVAGVAGEAVRRRAEEREALLLRALEESVSSREALDSILSLAPSFHRVERYDSVVLAICRGARETLDSLSASLYRYDRGRLVLLHRDPPTDLLPPGWHIDPETFPGLKGALDANLPSFVPDALTEHLPLAEAELARSVGARSVLRVPILLSPTSAYLLVLGWSESQGSLDTVRLGLAQRLADQAAVALEHAEAEALHRLLESSLLPHSRDPHPWLDISIRYLAGEGRLGIGGDFVDYVVHDDQGVSFVIGDVSGHGPDAAALGAALRSGWRALATAGMPPRQTLGSLDKVLFSERNSRNMYCTLLAGRIDGPTASLTLSNAGHPPPLLVAKDSRLLPVKPVLPLGCEHQEDWRLETFQLPEAWSLLLYTDGLFEGSVRPNAVERFGIDRLAERFGRAAPGPISEGSLDEVLAELQQANGKPLPDDVAALLISKREAGKPGSQSYRSVQPALQRSS